MTKIYLIATSVYKCYLCNDCRNKDIFLGNTSLAPREGGEGSARRYCMNVCALGRKGKGRTLSEMKVGRK